MVKFGRNRFRIALGGVGGLRRLGQRITLSDRYRYDYGAQQIPQLTAPPALPSRSGAVRPEVIGYHLLKPECEYGPDGIRAVQMRINIEQRELRAIRRTDIPQAIEELRVATVVQGDLWRSNYVPERATVGARIQGVSSPGVVRRHRKYYTSGKWYRIARCHSPHASVQVGEFLGRRRRAQNRSRLRESCQRLRAQVISVRMGDENDTRVRKQRIGGSRYSTIVKERIRSIEDRIRDDHETVQIDVTARMPEHRDRVAWRIRVQGLFVRHGNLATVQQSAQAEDCDTDPPSGPIQFILPLWQRRLSPPPGLMMPNKNGPGNSNWGRRAIDPVMAANGGFHFSPHVL